MIRLKSGSTINYEENLDLFFQKIFNAVITDSRKIVNDNAKGTESNEILNELYLKEIMDTCINITNQLFEMQKKSHRLSKFIISGFIFNGILMAIQTENIKPKPDRSISAEKNIIH